MKKLVLAGLLVSVMIGLIACEEQTYPEPKLTSISPAAKVYRMPGFQLTLDGENFTKYSKVYFNGKEVPTIYNGSAQLYANISSENMQEIETDLSYPGFSNQLTSVPVYVTNPLPGGGISEELEVEIKDKYTFDSQSQITSVQEQIINSHLYYYERNDDIHVSWHSFAEEEYYINYLYSKRDIANFSRVYRVTTYSGTIFSYKTQVIVDDNGVPLVLWHYRTSNPAESVIAIYYTKPVAGEDVTTFSSRREIIRTASQLANFKTVPFGAGNVFTAWIDIDANDNLNLFYNIMKSYGDEITFPERINQSHLNSTDFGWIIDPVNNESTIYASWSGIQQGKGLDGIYYTSSSDLGASFNQPILAVTPDNSSTSFRNAAVAVTGERIFVAWWEYNTKEPGQYRLMVANDLKGSTSLFPNKTEIVKMAGLNPNNLPAINLFRDKADNIFIGFNDGSFKVHLYRSADSGTSFNKIVDTIERSATAPIIITLNSEGSLLVLYSKIPENVNEGDDYTKPDLFFERSKE